MKFTGFWSRELFRSDDDNCLALDDSVCQHVGICASRSLLSAIAIVKAIFMVAWLCKEHLLREYNCQTLDWLSSRTFDQLDTLPNSTAEPIVLNRKNRSATVCFTDENFTPRQHSLFPVDEEETIDANARRSVDNKPIHSSEDTLRQDIPLKPGKRRKIIKIVRRPLTAERASGDLDDSFRRHWREVNPKTDFSAETSTDELRARVDTFGKLWRRVKIIKRRRKPKKVKGNDTIAFASLTSETVSLRQSDTDEQRQSVQTNQIFDRKDVGNERSTENDNFFTKTTNSPLPFCDKLTQEYPNNVPATVVTNPTPLSQPLQSTNSGKLKSSADKITQFRVLKYDALCVARTLLDAWCGVQLAALLLFLIGVAGYRRVPAAVKYLFMPHLILDSLLLLISFVFFLSTVVFDTLLFAFVAEMTLGQLGIWLAFAGLLTSLLVVYGVAFMLTLRCCKTIIHYLRQPAVNQFKDGAVMCCCPNCRGDIRNLYDEQHQLLIGHPINV